MHSNLPTEEQKKALCALMHEVFVDLRTLDGEQARDLAYAFHNLPLEMYGWGSWSIETMRGRLEHYQTKHQNNVGFNYVAAFNAIF